MTAAVHFRETWAVDTVAVTIVQDRVRGERIGHPARGGRVLPPLRIGPTVD
ncbi:hypothetical protein HBB16_14200 [Pseudonocardia sp. MCCB 268]|nr:hypothetical protein [Pseudonocardia cytotoxica]